MEVGGIVLVILAIAFIFLFFLNLSASFYGNYLVLKSCFGLSMVLSAVLLLVPGLNLIGFGLMAISGFMLFKGKCNVKKGLSRKSRLRSRSR